ncbi:hypothetical protein AB7303_05965 [Providencia rettgeri]|uniref:hypothetical protein n=1 Tax=unclassified Providencia TaxID=2633465 RepID=UPI00234ACEB8|nr:MULTISPECIES: hypothetical protein [unclassified Providencia]
MVFNIINTNVTEITLEQTPDSDKNSISMTSYYFYDQKEKKNVKASMDVALCIANKLKLTFKYNFFFKFEDEIINENLQDFMDEIDFHGIAYPYIRTYAVNLLNMSGHYITNPPIIPEF